LFPLTSFSCTVIVDVLVPFAITDVGEAVIREVAALADPGIKITFSVSVIGTPATVPETLDVPAVVEDVNVALYVPLLLSVTEDSVPRVFESTMMAPPLIKLFPLTSFN
jgi:hypothetical protein